MKFELYHVAATACSEVYDKNIALEWGTEYSHFLVDIQNQMFQVISVAGTDDLIDGFKNINLLSWKGIKLSAYRSAQRIMKDITLYEGLPTIVCGHSLGGTVAIALKRLFKADQCVVFAPARCLRYWTNRKMQNTTMFIDPNDPVTKLGALSFGLPICKTFKAADDHTMISIQDHYMKNWVNFTAELLKGNKNEY